MKKALTIVLVFILLFNLGSISFAVTTELSDDTTKFENNIEILKKTLKTKYLEENGNYSYGFVENYDESKITYLIRYYTQEDYLYFSLLVENKSGSASMVHVVAMNYYGPSIETTLKYARSIYLNPYTAYSTAESSPFYAKNYTSKSMIDIASINSTVTSYIETDKVLFSSDVFIAFSKWDDIVKKLCGFGMAGIGFTQLCQEHDYSKAIVTNATCEQEGLVRYTCKNCTYTYEETLEPLGHSKINREGVCSRCGEKVIDVSKCSCSCHKNDFFSKLITSIKMIFWKMFKTNKTCKCGTTHY